MLRNLWRLDSCFRYLGYPDIFLGQKNSQVHREMVGEGEAHKAFDGTLMYKNVGKGPETLPME